MKMDLLTNATAVDDAIRFVSRKSKEKSGSSSDNNNGNDDKVSNDTGYDQEEEETGEITLSTSITNQVF
jgi:hypothetical protein